MNQVAELQMEYEKEKQDLIEKYHEEIQQQENKHEREKVIFTFISLHYLSSTSIPRCRRKNNCCFSENYSMIYSAY